jgi:Glycosyl hydrolase family 85
VCYTTSCSTITRYDALTVNNKVSYQNTLSYSNLPFLKACGHMLTNYAWEPSLIDCALSIAAQNHIDPQNIYFGIDVWAQNRPRGVKHPRITYPEFDGGGTNTGVAVAKCKEKGVSAGIFGPGWSWEHFGPPLRHPVQRAMWEGIDLPERLECPCWSGRPGAAEAHRSHYADAAIVKSAYEAPAGSSEFFWTDFSRAFTRHDSTLNDIYHGRTAHTQLGSQSVLPQIHPPAEEGDEASLWLRLEDSPCRALVGVSKFINSLPLLHPGSSLDLALFKLNLRVPREDHRALVLNVLHSSPPGGQCHHVQISLNSEGGTLCYDRTLPPSSNLTRSAFLLEDCEQNLPQSGRPAEFRLVEMRIKVFVSSGCIMDGPTEIINLHEISVFPAPSGGVPTPPYRAANIHADLRGTGDSKQVRLCWDLSHSTIGEWEPLGSPTTGPFSHFEVEIDDQIVGRAYALEMILPEHFVQRWNGPDGIEVKITGVIFGGQRSETVECGLRREDMEWEIVE